MRTTFTGWFPPFRLLKGIGGDFPSNMVDAIENFQSQISLELGVEFTAGVAQLIEH